jgi:hypothetical protein
VLLIKEIGSDALLALLALSAPLGEPYSSRIRSFYEHCRNGDLAVALHRPTLRGSRAESVAAAQSRCLPEDR